MSKVLEAFAALENAIGAMLADSKTSNVDFHKLSILKKSVVRLRKSL